ncbi:hypothetical protein BKA62DRAFT_621614, partial [Auriculariales sp. MPI-PUGE-AT-0066]
TEYEKLYPPDKYGEELGANARVFKVYRDRVSEKDEDLVQGLHDTLNVLLVFAGLFSAVLTGFLVESSKQLQPDHAEITATAVVAILAHLQASKTESASIPMTSFSPTRDVRWINGLWFSSLTLALIVSLLAILFKQWLVQYTSLSRSSASDSRRWAWRHCALRRGLSRWRVEQFISWLAILLHVSLFLFLAGLTRFIRALDPVIFKVLMGMSIVTGAFYLLTTLAPLIWAECPTRTPVLRELEIQFAGLRHIVALLWTTAHNCTVYLGTVSSAIVTSITNRDFDLVWRINFNLEHRYPLRKRAPLSGRS